MNEDLYNPEWANQTTLHPVGLIAVGLLGICMVSLPRRYAVFPMAVLACFIAPAQRLVVFSLDFNLLRLMVIFGWVRLLTRGEHRSFAWKSIDTIIVLWGLSGTIIYTLQQGDLPTFINRLGWMFDAVGMYFLFRCLVRGWEDVDGIIAGFCLLAIPVAVAFINEMLTTRNVFAVFGGVPETTKIREGRLRCQGAFAHPILAGCFWATLVPLITARWWSPGRPRALVLAGVISSLTIVMLTASSTPVMAVFVGLVGACMFPLRHRIRLLFCCFVLSLVALHLVMRNPVWHLIARIDIVGGSTGYHRFLLIDQAIEHFGEWWLIGTTSTADWHEGLVDITNQYILEGIRGGLLTMVLCISLIVSGFLRVGDTWRSSGGDTWRLYLSWALGVSLFMHSVIFFGVSYFGQIIVVWYLLLAMIASLSPPKRARHPLRMIPRRTMKWGGWKPTSYIGWGRPGSVLPGRRGRF